MWKLQTVRMSGNKAIDEGEERVNGGPMRAGPHKNPAHDIIQIP